MARLRRKVPRLRVMDGGWAADLAVSDWPPSATRGGDGAGPEASLAEEWPRLRAAIAAALRPHPEALGSVKEVLGRWSAA